jgi:hypothetical protein
MNELNIKKKTLIDNDVVSVWYYPEQNIIHHKVKKFVYGEKFKNFLMTGADHCEKEGCFKWLSDDRNNSAIRTEDREWGINNWKPRMVKAGWKYWAIMMPDRLVGKMSMKHLISEYSEVGVTVEIFDDVDLALKWLDEQT